MASRTCALLCLLTATLCAVDARRGTSAAPAAPTSSSGDTQTLRFSSPLQSYTIFDKAALAADGAASPRRRFLPRFRTGLLAERRAREVLMEERRRGIGFGDDDDADAGGGEGGWADASAAADRRQEKARERRVEAAYDAAVQGHDVRTASQRSLRAASRSPATSGATSGKYQFVGVVQDGKVGQKAEPAGVTWYARNKPRQSKWNVRLVHVNRDAVLRELFVKGKVDVYGKYVNEGLAATQSAAFAAADAAGADEEQLGLKPVVKAHYAVKERSWKNLYNFSPRRMFTTPSGAFWRERRLSPGLYTDGTTVYESVYRYRDGKNGMKPLAKMSRFLESPSALGLGVEEKMNIVARLRDGDAPDVVVEN